MDYVHCMSSKSQDSLPIVFLWTLVYSNKGTSAGRRGLEMQVYAAAPNWETGKHKVIHHGERCFYGWLLKIILKIIAFHRLLFRNDKKVCYTIWIINSSDIY